MRPSVRACGVCRRVRKIEKAGADGQPDQCDTCWQRNPASWRRCQRCGERRRRTQRSGETGELVCPRCRRRAQPKERCQRCGQLRVLALRGLRGGQALCQPCYTRSLPERRCGRCGRLARIVARARSDGTPELCSACWEAADIRLCGICGLPGRVRLVASATGPDICERCYTRPTARCSVCGHERPCLFAAGEAPICRPCQRRRYPKETCVACGELRHVEWRSPTGPVCARCRHRHLAAKITCQACHQTRRPATVRAGEVLCADCTGMPSARRCSACGTEDHNFDVGLCPRCSLKRRVDAVRATGDPAAISGLDPYLEALAASPQPRSILSWLHRSRGARTLEALARGELELSHAALDTIDTPGTTAIKFLRAASSSTAPCPSAPSRSPASRPGPPSNSPSCPPAPTARTCAPTRPGRSRAPTPARSHVGCAAHLRRSPRAS